MFPTVRCCSPLCKDVPQCARMLLTVQDVPQCVQVFSTMRGFSPLCPGIPHCVGMFHSERGYSHLCAGVPHCVQVFPTVQGCSSILRGDGPYFTHVPRGTPPHSGEYPTHWGKPLHTEEHLRIQGNDPAHWGTSVHTVEHFALLIQLSHTVQLPRTVENYSKQ